MEGRILKYISGGDIEENWQREDIWSIYVSGRHIYQAVPK
jgi:hypothetical protein